MFINIKQFFLLMISVTMVLGQGISPPDTSALDTNALLIEWKHKTLTENMVKFGGTAFVLPLLFAQEGFDNSQYSQLCFAASAFGMMYGFKKVQSGKEEKIRNLRHNLLPNNPEIVWKRKVDPSSYLLSMAWRSILGFGIGSLIGASLDIVSSGLLPDNNNDINHVMAGAVAGGIYGFYKGLENSNKNYDLPVGSPFQSIWFAALTNYALEYGYYHTINKNAPPDNTQFLISCSLYFGYNYPNWKDIFSKNE